MVWGGQPMGNEEDGSLIVPAKNSPLRTITVGGDFSQSLSGYYADTLGSFWRPGNAVLFYNGRTQYNEVEKFTASPGLVLRYLLADREVIFGVNGYYEMIDGRGNNQFGSFGFGGEVLSKWIDARVNYYLPTTADTELGGTQRVTRSGQRTITEYFRSYEAVLGGVDGEVGFLIPGLERYLEVRIFGGYYRFDNPFGDGFSGFKARLEARVLPGLVVGVQWYEEEYLNGGQWVSGVSVQVPFDFWRIFRGKNPFEGAGEAFQYRRREFRERMSEMVVRGTMVSFVGSGEVLFDKKTTYR